ncbi:MAG: (2Fe-2S)-binding protein [Clostridiales Family XIII bacterium]|jgi:NAD(P)H-nitrite reductase large subunit|nr:(2Fe-2S)-binding protein [Clostridiales Family XIII bacterium]
MAKITIRMKSEGAFLPQADDDMIVCRCEEVTKGEIRRAVCEGLRTFGEVKRYLRCGMGLCQGQTCQRLILQILSRELGTPIPDLGRITGRTPVRPVVMQELSRSTEDSKGVEDHALS